jgi:hypothetical protein
MMPVQPMTPSEVRSKKLESIPDEVIAAMNELLCENVKVNAPLGVVYVSQSDFVLRIIETYEKNNKAIDRDEIFGNGWLDIEPIFVNAGWEVNYSDNEFRFRPVNIRNNGAYQS